MADTRILLDIPPGIDSDDTTFAAHGRWANCSNVRFFNGRPETFGPNAIDLVTLCGARVSAMLAAPFSASPFTPSPLLVTGSTTKLGVCLLGSGGDVTDITPSPAPATMDQWSLQMWGTELVASPQGGTLYHWTGASFATKAAVVTGPPAAITCMLVAAQERQVIAFGCNVEAAPHTFNPLCIRWSDFEDYTNWTSSPTNNAGEFILDGVGSIIAARQLGDYLAVWTDTSLYLGRFIGDPSQTWAFDKVATGAGLIGPRAVTIVDSTAYWLSQDLRLYQWQVGTVPVPVPCPITHDFTTNCAGGADRLSIAVGTVRRYGEVWIFYPDSRDAQASGTNTRYIAYCINESIAAQRPVWFRGNFGRTAFLDDGILHAAFSAQAAPVLMAKEAGGLDLHELTDQSSPVAWFIQSADQYADSGGLRVMVKGAVPDFSFQVGTVSLTLFCRNRPMSTAVTKGPYAITAGASKKDFRASGMIIAAKFSGLTGTAVRIGVPAFTATTQGGR